MFVGRKEQLADLMTLWRKRSSSIVACRGRRRIGKSTLFREFARRSADVYIEIEGLAPQREKPPTVQDQLDHFIEVLSGLTGCDSAKVDNWFAAFRRLEEQIDDAKKTVILLDEISWMAGGDVNFPGKLRTAWETLFHRHEHLILVVCGSVSGWIKRNILGNTGFTGRFSRDYVLKELTLAECAEFWGAARERLAPREILDVLSVTGGVPRYLEEVDPGLSADENVKRMCFLKSGELYKDFDAIFDPIWGEGTVLKRKILEALAEAPMTAGDLAKAVCSAYNGRFIALMKELVEGGFVDDDPGRNPETGKPVGIARYRLRDNYTRFFLKYVAPHKQEIEYGSYSFTSIERLPGWDAIMGLQFENLVVNNSMQLVRHLGIGNAIVESAAPYRNSKRAGKGGVRGCQVDLLIQTARTAYVVEVKRKRFIDEGVVEEVEEKVRRLPLRKTLSARPVLVYDGELLPSVEGCGYFDAIVPASDLLGL